MNIKQVLEIIPSSLGSLLTLFLITRLLGKKQVSQLSLFDYVIGISIGNFSAEMIINRDVQYINGIMAILVFGFVAYLVNLLSMKSIWIRRWVMGCPTIIIEDGKIIEKNMKKVNMDINDLLELCRTAGYFHIEEIAYAILEASGQLSVLPKTKYKPVTQQDMHISNTKESLDCNVIIDGKYMPHHIKNANKNRMWVEKELKKQGYSNAEMILLGIIHDNKLILFPKNNQSSIDVLE